AASGLRGRLAEARLRRWGVEYLLDLSTAEALPGVHGTLDGLWQDARGRWQVLLVGAGPAAQGLAAAAGQRPTGARPGLAGRGGAGRSGRGGGAERVAAAARAHAGRGGPGAGGAGARNDAGFCERDPLQRTMGGINLPASLSSLPCEVARCVRRVPPCG